MNPLRPSTRPLRVVVADDHHHILPEIHFAIRKRVLPFEGIHIVHFDAHPDLSFSSTIPPQTIFAPDQLYDALDESVSGIAEFLLPLVFAGHVNHITWVKSPWGTQMPSGSMKDIAIGRHAATDHLVVSCPLAHFIDDDLYAPESDIDPSSIKRWTLDVVEDPHAATLSTPWILDIDLDYFSTWNPFRMDLEAPCDVSTLQILTNVFTGVRYRSATDQEPNDRIRERHQFLQAMRRLENEQLYLDPESTEAVQVRKILETLYDGDTETILTKFFEILRHADAMTRTLVWNAAPCLDLPHFENPEDGLQTMLDHFQAYVGSISAPPALVTVATSVSDRFLPPHQLDFVQNRVLSILRTTLGPLDEHFIEYEPVEDH